MTPREIVGFGNENKAWELGDLTDLAIQGFCYATCAVVYGNVNKAWQLSDFTYVVIQEFRDAMTCASMVEDVGFLLAANGIFSDAIDSVNYE